MMRFCPECGSLGDVVPPARECCPDWGKAAFIPEQIADLARVGFFATRVFKQMRVERVDLPRPDPRCWPFPGNDDGKH
jgi:hypothetical protein